MHYIVLPLSGSSVWLIHGVTINNGKIELVRLYYGRQTVIPVDTQIHKWFLCSESHRTGSKPSYMIWNYVKRLYGLVDGELVNQPDKLAILESILVEEDIPL